MLQMHDVLQECISLAKKQLTQILEEYNAVIVSPLSSQTHTLPRFNNSLRSNIALNTEFQHFDTSCLILAHSLQ